MMYIYVYIYIIILYYIYSAYQNILGIMILPGSAAGAAASNPAFPLHICPD